MNKATSYTRLKFNCFINYLGLTFDLNYKAFSFSLYFVGRSAIKLISSRSFFLYRPVHLFRT